jgi:NTP pyrophosphatase (non-canonical NTP hydrolase)
VAEISMSTSKLGQKHLLQQIVDQCIADSGKYFALTDRSDFEQLKHHVLALCGEAGELANIVKKIDRGSYDFDTEAVKILLEGEVTDVFIYLMDIYGVLGIDPFTAFIRKRDFNNKRFLKPKEGR